MSLPFVSRERYEEMQFRLEMQLKDLQKRYDDLQARSDALAASVLESDKQKEEDQGDDEPISLRPTIATVRNWANGYARQRAQEGKKKA